MSRPAEPPTTSPPPLQPGGDEPAQEDELWHPVPEQLWMEPRPEGTEVLHEHPAGATTDGVFDYHHDVVRRATVIPAWQDETGHSPTARSIELQRWEGIVQEVAEKTFTAVLHDVSADAADEYAELPIDEVGEADRPLLSPGAVFYWWVGYRDSVGGRTRASVIRLRRLPGATAEELDRARSDAARLLNVLDPTRQP